jgi:ketosteroid isomerase-like protein
MPQERETVELVRQAYDAFNRQDYEAWLRDFVDPEVDFREVALTLDSATYRGHAGVRAWMEKGQEAFAGVWFEVENITVRDDAVVTTIWAHGRGAGSGAEFRTRIAHAMRLRNGKAVFIASYPDKRQALEAVGLSEQDISP